jgi:hypothetical protein
VINLEGDVPEAVEGMLFYLYCLEYPRELYEGLLGGSASGSGGSDSGIEEDEESSSSQQDARTYWGFDLMMYTIADKYGLDELRKMARESLTTKAKRAGNVKQRDDFPGNLDGFAALIEELYADEDVAEHLRAFRTEIVGSTSEALTPHVRDPRLSVLIADVPSFAVELVEALGKKRDEQRIVHQEEDSRKAAERRRLSHIPMNDESDYED